MYKQKYFYFRKVGRIPSIRRNHSESDALNVETASLPVLCNDNNNVFVQTHLTLFTVTGDENSNKNKVTPTILLETNEDDFPSTKTVIQTNLTETDTKRLPVEKSHSLFFDNLNSSNYLSSSIESKKKVLNSANSSSPAVKNMIEQYNKRISEKQELLINPFKPGDPFGKKRPLGTSNVVESNFSVQEPLVYPTGSRAKIKETGQVLKSHSATALPSSFYSTLSNQQATVNSVSNNQIGIDNNWTSTGTLTGSSVYLSKHTPMLSTDASLDSTAEDTCGSNSTLCSPSINSNRRAEKIKLAKETFLAGSTSTCSNNNQEEKDEIRSLPGESSSIVEGPTKPPRTFGHNADIPKNNSFRRQSEGCLATGSTQTQNVLKSASSGVIGTNSCIQRLPTSKKRCSKTSDNFPDGGRKNSKGLFKIFRRSKAKDSKDLSTVQRLCQQAMNLEVPNNEDISAVPSSSNSPALLNVPSTLTNHKGFSAPENPGTLPRQGVLLGAPPSPSLSCPASPATQRKSRTAKLLEKGKKIFKNQPPSPR